MKLAGLFVAATFAVAAQVAPEKVGEAAHPKPLQSAKVRFLHASARKAVNYRVGAFVRVPEQF